MDYSVKNLTLKTHEQEVVFGNINKRTKDEKNKALKDFLMK